MRLPTVSVVIPSHGRPDLLGDVLSPLLADEATLEVIVVVDGPNTTAEAALEGAKADPRVQAVVFPANRGRSAARQVGVEAATGDVVLLLDDDAIACAGLVTGHARHHAHDDGLVVVGYLHTPEPPLQKGNFATILYARESENAFRQYEIDSESILRKLWGGNISLRRQECLSVGLAVEGFENHYFEDTDFGLRAADAGLHGVFDRTLVADHRHERSMTVFLRDAYSQGRGSVMLKRRHRHPTASVVLRDLVEDVPKPLRLPARWVRSATGVNVVTPALLQVAHFHSFVELNVGRFLRRLHQWRGIVDMEKELENQ